MKWFLCKIEIERASRNQDKENTDLDAKAQDHQTDEESFGDESGSEYEDRKTLYKQGIPNMKEIKSKARQIIEYYNIRFI